MTKREESATAIEEIVEETPTEQAQEETVTEGTVQEVLPPENEETPVKEEKESDGELSAEELRRQLEESKAEINRLREGKEDEPDEPEPEPEAKLEEQATMSQTFVSQVMPAAKKQYIAEEDPGKQFDLMLETNNQLVGAVVADRIAPGLQQLAIESISLRNELELRDLREDPDFKAVEKNVRKQLSKTPWNVRSQTDAVTAIFHRIRGSMRNGEKPTQKKTTNPTTPPARKQLKDIAAGGGASPKPSGIRLTNEQETDYQGMLENGIDITRSEYFAKYKARVDQAKARGVRIPKTYRG